MNHEINVYATWDTDAGVWVATSQDVPGLATEASTIETLFERLKVIIPELLELNSGISGKDIPFRLYSERSDVARAS
jgi:predicted RNase H-like HicB family nuclease